MLILPLLLALLASGAAASNPCHADCQPFMCHGPLQTHCESCTGNTRLVLGRCACKVGWFDKPGNPCSVYVFDCVAGNMDSAFNVFCTQCEHLVNGPVNGVCEPRNFAYWDAFDPSLYAPTESEMSRSIYSSGHCNAVSKDTGGPIFRCRSCTKNGFLASGNQLCQPCPLAGCDSCGQSPVGTCANGCGDGLFFNPANPSCDFCFLACRRCTGRGISSCSECKSGFYWQPNDFDSLGTCMPCNPQCETCFGPGATDCGILTPGFYLQNSGQLSNSSAVCAASCGRCDSSGRCTTCMPASLDTFDQYLLDESTGTCTLSDNTPWYPSCADLVLLTNGTYFCQTCEAGYAKDMFDNNNCNTVLSISKCNFTLTPNDQREVACSACGYDPARALNKDTGSCDQFTTAESTGCKSGVSLSGKFYCLLCDAGMFVELLSGQCVPTCPTGQINLAYNDDIYDGQGNLYKKAIELCYPLPAWCLDGILNPQKQFFCTVCDSANNYVKYQPTDLDCINLNCNNQNNGPNKPCNPITSPTTCDPNLCLLTDDSADCTAGSCTRKMFQLEFAGLNFKVTVRSKYSSYLSFDVKDYVVYETVSPTFKRLFCRLLSDDLNDDLSTCSWENGSLQIETIDAKYRSILTSGKITLKQAAFKIYRNRLSLDGIDISAATTGFNFMYSSEVPLLTTGTKWSNWVVHYQKTMLQSKGLQASLVKLSDRFELSSFSWQLVSVSPNAGLAAQLTASLATMANKNLNLPLNSGFVGQAIVINLNIVDEFGQIHTLKLDFDVVAGTYALELAHPSSIFFNSAETVYIPLLSSVPGLATDQVVITGSGLPLGATLQSTVIKRSTSFILSIKVTDAGDFNLLISYSGYVTTTIRMIRSRPYYPSLILHERDADTLNPFVLQVLSRKNSFKLYCVDELAMKPCLSGVSPKSLSIGDAVTLEDKFNFTAPNPQTLFIRFGTGGKDETVSSVQINGVMALVNSESNTSPSTPLLDNRASVMYPESPYFRNSADNQYVDFRYSEASNVVGQQGSYLDLNFQTQNIPYNFELSSSKRQAVSVSPPSGIYRWKSQLQVTLNSSEEHHLVESRFSSVGDASSLLISTQSKNSYLQVDFVTSMISGGLCNDPAGLFTTMLVLDNRFYLADVGPFMRRIGLPGVLPALGVPASSRIYSFCGPTESTATSLVDDSGLSFSSSLTSYMTYMLANLGATQQEQMNSLNFLLLQLSVMYRKCSSGQCQATNETLVTETARLVGKLTDTYEDSKYYMTTRYSLLNGFLSDPGLLADLSLIKVLEAIELTSSYLVAALHPVVLENNRLSRNLKLQISSLNLLQSDMVDLPVLMGSNLLDKFLFSFFDDPLRNQMFNRTINQIVRFKEMKLLRVSSHKRVEEYTDDTMRVQGMTAMSPLESEYPFQLNPTTVILFKNINFENPTSYYEFVIISWPNSLLDKMRPLYNKSTNDFEKRSFYYTFTSDFETQQPVSGEVQVHRKVCESVNLTGCTPSHIVNYELCYCISAPVYAGTPPTADYTPPAKKPDKPSTPSNPLTDTFTGVKEVLLKPSNMLLDPTRVTNFRVWCFSTLVLETFFFCVYVTAVCLRARLNKTADDFCTVVGVKVMIHRLLLQPKPTERPKSADSGTTMNIDDVGMTISSSNSSSPATSETPSAQQKRVWEDLQRVAIIKNIPIETLKESDLKRFTFFSFYRIFLNLNHACVSMAFLKSVRYTRFSLITITFCRLIAHLAISMYFTLGSLG